METYLRLSEAAKLLPHRPHVASVWRWCRRGVRTRMGDRIRLEHVRFGSRVFTTQAALDKFCKAVADGDLAHFEAQAERHAKPATPKGRSAKRREADVADAKRQCEAAGV